MTRVGGIGIVAGLTIVLAGLDIVESVLAKEWSVRRDHWLLLAGIATSFALFALFVVAIRFTEMSTVTIGWIVLMQGGLMITERVRYGIHHATGTWLAIGAMVVLQVYVISSSSTRG